jgi:hypothetical protein
MKSNRYVLGNVVINYEQMKFDCSDVEEGFRSKGESRESRLSPLLVGKGVKSKEWKGEWKGDSKSGSLFGEYDDDDDDSIIDLDIFSRIFKKVIKLNVSYRVFIRTKDEYHGFSVCIDVSMFTVDDLPDSISYLNKFISHLHNEIECEIEEVEEQYNCIVNTVDIFFIETEGYLIYEVGNKLSLDLNSEVGDKLIFSLLMVSS